MQRSQQPQKRSRGIAIVLTTLTLSVTLPLVGLGFDVGTLYLIRSKLVGCRGCRGIGRRAGPGPGSQRRPPRRLTPPATAQTFFNGNFPAGYWRTTGASATVSIDSTIHIPITARSP